MQLVFKENFDDSYAAKETKSKEFSLQDDILLSLLVEEHFGKKRWR